MLLTAILLLIASQLPIVAAGMAKSGTFRSKENRYDNHEPRLWMERQTDPRRRRANAAQANSFEALPFLFAAALFALYLKAPLGLINGLLIAWLVLRAVYLWCYLNDQASLRSLVWSVALLVNIALLFAPFYG
ncbi:MAG: MAPEG family protein [Thiomonas sp.]|uniref:MAPEG family protein n=1 Tax=Thiomonas sp. TaxID=2047785 RepID=UPI002A358A3E|nr:MAPEG family protein [Thiomonas sp.]MDY0330346.1 MAPEG family protein [Thiomonas sp.]